MRRAYLLIAMGFLAWTLCTATALGAKEHAREQGFQAAEHELERDIGEEAKEVQHDLFDLAMDLGIWTLVIFLILLFVLGKFAWKPMMQGLEHRERAITSALHEAQQAREEAAKLRTQFEEQLRQADDRARQVLDEARRAAERSAAEMTAEAQKKIQAEHDRLKREMNLEYDRARRDIQTQAAQLATLIAGKVIRRHIGHDDHRQLVDEALNELRQTENGRPQTALV